MTVITARRDGDRYVLNGVKQFISGAGAAGVYIVMAHTGAPGPRGISAILVPNGTPGLRYGPNEKKMGWNAQPTRQVILEDVRVPVSNRLGAEGDGFEIAMKGLNGGQVNIAACSLGGVQWALERAAAYVQERVAFGAPLSANQSVVFALADMETNLQAGRALLERAAGMMDAGDPVSRRSCSGNGSGSPTRRSSMWHPTPPVSAGPSPPTAPSRGRCPRAPPIATTGPVSPGR